MTLRVRNAKSSIWAILPIKLIATAKQRLSNVLSSDERQALFRCMLNDVFAAINDATTLQGLLVVTRDAHAKAMAHEFGARVFEPPTDDGQSAAVAAAARMLSLEGVKSIITLPGDVPLMKSTDIDAVCNSIANGSKLSVVPNGDNSGTNCIACSPPDAIKFQFGESSFQKHVQAASTTGIDANVMRLPSMSLDIDARDDLIELMLHDVTTATQRYLMSTGIAARFTQHELLMRASYLRDKGHGDNVSFSKKVFIPLTRLCRDVCHYCTYAKTPRYLERAFMTSEEVLETARRGQAAGCKEALFTLGDKPEQRYRVAREALEAMGYTTTLEYVAAMAELVFKQTGLLPHINAGVMTGDEIDMLKHVSISQGLMLESASERLCEKGGPHYGSPDKLPHRRLNTIRLAGERNVPFTTGILIGIGETRAERLESLYEIRKLHQEFGHIQEIIIQNFRAKPDTLMANATEPTQDELQWTVAATRLMFGPEMNIQVPPNLNNGDLDGLVCAGINDWGGVSPITPDFVNPEAPWPHLEQLASQTSAAGKKLVERLAVYPKYLFSDDGFIGNELKTSALDWINAHGFARTDTWSPGQAAAVPFKIATQQTKSSNSRNNSYDRFLSKTANGDELTENEVVKLFAARDDAFHHICAAADELRNECNGNIVSYVINRNINYTNVCYFRCGFCAFSKGKHSAELRGKSYDLALDEITRRVREAVDRGATEVCMQGGIHPKYTGATYLEICRAIKAEAPDIHIHAFSPLEIWQGAHTLGLSIETFLEQLQRAGLNTLPGTAAEILDDEVRRVICPDKINTEQWLDVVKTAHEVGLKTTSTIMFGHVDQPKHWARHLLRLRNLQIQTGGITEFVPLPFVHAEAPMYLKGRARKGPTYRESILMHAVARLVLFPHITNIQTSWVKMGAAGAAVCLSAGCNDLGGTLMNESISRAAGSEHGQEMSPTTIERLVRQVGRTPLQRTTLYDPVTNTQSKKLFEAMPLGPIVNTAPARRVRTSSTVKSFV